MTEPQYLTSTDPAAMRTLLVERGLWTERKCRVFQSSCRWLMKEAGGPDLSMDPLDSNPGGVGGWSTSGVVAPATDLVPNHVRAALIRDIWGNPWRLKSVCRVCKKGSGYGGIWEKSKYCSRGSDPDGKWDHRWELIIPINPDWLTYRNGLVPELAKAAVTPGIVDLACGGRACQKCGGSGGEKLTYGRHRCQKCNGTGTVSLTGHIDPLRLAVLADALEEAGCGDDGLLGHLRAVEWVCECGKCTCDGWPSVMCDKSSTRPISHIWTSSGGLGGGCWVLELLQNPLPAAV